MVQKSLISQFPVEWRERRRLQRRFARIEKTLRARDCSHLSPELRQMRQATLDHLHNYGKRGIFPRNFEFPNQHRPVFIDPSGHTCAVAQLMIDSGAGSQAALISKRANFAYIREMDFPELNDWVTSSGLSRDEAAWIQPSYPDYSLTVISRLPYQIVLISATTIGVLLFVQSRLPRKYRLIPRILIALVVCVTLYLVVSFGGVGF